jgi:hypothetical protein
MTSRFARFRVPRIMLRSSRILVTPLALVLLGCSSGGGSSGGSSGPPGSTGTLEPTDSGFPVFNGAAGAGTVVFSSTSAPALAGADILQIESDGTTLFVTAESGIFSVPRGGGTVNTVAASPSGTANPRILSIGLSTLTTLLPSTSADAAIGQTQIFTIPKTGGAASPGPLVPDNLYISVAADANNLYYAASKPGDGGTAWTIDSLPLAGGPVTTLTATSYIASSLIPDTGYLYYTDRNSLADGGVEFPVFRVPLSGGMTTPLNVKGVSLVTDSAYVYFDGDSHTGIMRVAKDGSGGATLISPIALSGLAIQSGTLYGYTIAEVISGKTPGVAWIVCKVPASGGTMSVLGVVPSTPVPTALGVDESNVYLAIGGPQVVSMPR